MNKQTFLDRIIEVCKNNPIDISKLPSYADTDTEGWFYLEGDAGRGYSINYVNRMTYDGYAYMASFIIEDTSSDFCLPNPPSESLCFIFQEINTIDGSSTTVSEIPDEFAEHTNCIGHNISSSSCIRTT